MQDPNLTLTPASAPAATEPPLDWRILLLALALLLVAGEIGCRLFWVAKTGAPFFSPRMLRYAQYPSLRTSGADRAHASRNGDTFDVLILGGSTVSDVFSSISTRVRDGLAAALHRKVRVFDVAYPAHNSRDSLLKYHWLEGEHFDLVLVYDGISDARMDNVPPERYRADYGHCHWYQLGNRLLAHPALFTAALPYTLLFGFDRIAEESGARSYVSPINPRPEWTTYGKNPQSVAALKQNLSEILSTARARGDRVGLITFASFIPSDFDREVARTGHFELGSAKGVPVKLIGEEANVVAALAAYNGAIRDLAARNPGTLLIDQERLLPANNTNFLDCCHLREPGSAIFAQNVVAAVAAALR